MGIFLRMWKESETEFRLVLEVDSTDYFINVASRSESSCREVGEALVKDFATCGVAVEHPYLYSCCPASERPKG